MLVEEQSVTESARVGRMPRLRLTWELDEVSVARQVAAWAALAVTVAVALALLFGG
jgi:hypothetical protein